MVSTFCPNCGTPRVGSLRFCRSCQFDFDAIGTSPPVSPGVFQPSSLPATTSTEAPFNIPAAAVVVGGLLVAIGSFLPWYGINAGLLGSVTRNGIDGGGDGVITLLVGIGLTLIGASAFVMKGTTAHRALTIVLGVIGLGMTAFDFVNVQNWMNDLTDLLRPNASVGFGLIVVGVGAGIAFLAGWRLRGSPTTGAAPRRVCVHCGKEVWPDRERLCNNCGLPFAEPQSPAG